jgi:hypothetical protein
VKTIESFYKWQKLPDLGALWSSGTIKLATPENERREIMKNPEFLHSLRTKLPSILCISKAASSVS